jgi:hypothetical protein
MPSFSTIFQAVCQAHGISTHQEEPQVFTRIRNDIVHRFKYNPDTTLPTAWRYKEKPTWAIHFFTASFIDDLILQLFGLRRARPSPTT